ncbi:DUF2141 domain-containing protein [Alkalimonas collagenimarina]|uniref:DUF2141 domain-containing protein n=1 Tax=Alkalimonas collagenimarina TaxID=400390 RepID=A0ABT9GWR1_9GAMM|nr:DUF2141 domain-containing protein [Alkalimonas collagenimarina]MDP4535120.1 DUF2141 domain-containing protein [Alkalimonas collagenimarina]
MRTIKTLALTAGVLSSSVLHAGDIAVTIDNLTANKGKIYASLCQQNDFMRGRCGFEIVRQVLQPQQTLIFNDVVAGTYAVSVFYDVNDNGKLDTNLFGIPKEPTGVSNNVTGRNGPPKFEDASFEVKTGQSIQLQIRVF